MTKHMDIVERLRTHPVRLYLYDEAADEIERLRAALEWVEQNSAEQNIAGYAGRAACGR